MQDEMMIDERRKYVKLMVSRYQKAKRKARALLERKSHWRATFTQSALS